MFPDIWSEFAQFISTPGVVALVQIVTAVATASSVIVALVISARAEHRQDSRDRVEQTAGLERRAERQSVLIKTSPSGSTQGGAFGSRTGYQVEVNNLSELPVYKLTASLLLTADGKSGEYAAQEKPVLYGRREMSETPFIAEANSIVEAVRSNVAFTDAYGDRWSLHADGTLVLVAARTIRETYQFSSKPLKRRQRKVR